MKRTSTIILLAALIISCSYTANAQFTKSSKLISAGVSLGLYGKYYHDYTNVNLNRVITPPFNIQFEKGIGADKAGLGDLSSMITAGVFLGFQGQRYFKDVQANLVEYEVYKNYTYIWGGVVGTFHSVPLINEHTTLELDENKWDFYLSIKSGIVFENYQSNYLNDPTDIDVQMGTIDDNVNKTFFYIGPVLGARYYVNEKIGFYAEVGRANLSNLSVGLSMKFN